LIPSLFQESISFRATFVLIFLLAFTLGNNLALIDGTANIATNAVTIKNPIIEIEIMAPISKLSLGELVESF